MLITSHIHQSWKAHAPALTTCLQGLFLGHGAYVHHSDAEVILGKPSWSPYVKLWAQSLSHG